MVGFAGRRSADRVGDQPQNLARLGVTPERFLGEYQRAVYLDLERSARRVQ